MNKRVTGICLIVVLIIASSGCSGKVFENLKNVKQAIAKQEQFVGLTRGQVVERFGKPATFQNIGAVRSKLMVSGLPVGHFVPDILYDLTK